MYFGYVYIAFTYVKGWRLLRSTTAFGGYRDSALVQQRVGKDVS